MNWFRSIKKANAQLGTMLGKWLVLESYGQRNETSVQNDIMNFVTQNSSSIDSSAARQAALSFYTTQTKQQPPPNIVSILDQWLSMVDGNSIAPTTVDSGSLPGGMDESIISV